VNGSCEPDGQKGRRRGLFEVRAQLVVDRDGPGRDRELDRGRLTADQDRLPLGRLPRRGHILDPLQEVRDEPNRRPQVADAQLERAPEVDLDLDRQRGVARQCDFEALDAG
jgi:hypothetical protein